MNVQTIYKTLLLSQLVATSLLIYGSETSRYLQIEKLGGKYQYRSVILVDKKTTVKDLKQNLERIPQLHLEAKDMKLQWITPHQRKELDDDNMLVSHYIPIKQSDEGKIYISGIETTKTMANLPYNTKLQKVNFQDLHESNWVVVKFHNCYTIGKILKIDDFGEGQILYTIDISLEEPRDFSKEDIFGIFQ